MSEYLQFKREDRGLAMRILSIIYFILKNETSQPPVLIDLHTTDPFVPYLNAEARRSGPTGFRNKASETILASPPDRLSHGR